MPSRTPYAARRWGRTSAVARASLERVVVALDGDVVAGAHGDEAVGQLAVGVEAARQLQRAEPAAERERHVRPVGGPFDERRVELGVVGDEHVAREAIAQLVEHGVDPGRATQRAAGDAVHPARPDPAPRPPQRHERRPRVDDGAVELDRHDPDLEDAVAARRQSGRLHVDHGEPRHTHAADPTPGVSQAVIRVFRASECFVRGFPARSTRCSEALGWIRRVSSRPSRPSGTASP